MTSHIRSHIEFSILNYNIMVLLSQSNLTKNLASSTGFQYDLMIIRKWLTFWATCIYLIKC